MDSVIHRINLYLVNETRRFVTGYTADKELSLSLRDDINNAVLLLLINLPY